MASIRKRADMGGVYELDYYDIDGRRYRVNTRTQDRKIAKLWLQKVEELLSLASLGVIEKVGRITRTIVAGQEQPGTTKRFRLDAWKDEYLERCRMDLELAKNTSALIHCAFDSFRAVIGNPFIDMLKDMDMRRWKRALIQEGKSKNTISIYQRALKTAFNRAVKWKLIAENPFKEVELPSIKHGEKPNKSMNFSQVRTLLSVVKDVKYRRFLQFLVYTACRRNEILFLKREDLNLEQNVLYVHIPKTNRRLALPINKALQRVIAQMQENGEWPESGYLFTSESNRRGKDIGLVPWHPTTVSHWFKDYITLAGLPDHFSLHSLRHTYVTFLRSKGVPPEAIQPLLGHSSVQTTGKYDHSDALFFRQFADLVDFDTQPENEEPKKDGDDNKPET